MVSRCTDRGRIAVGYKADLNVIDHQNLRLHKPVVTYDLPAGGRRLDQTADGYVATVVSGEIIAEKVDFLSRPKSAENENPELVDRDDEIPF